MRNIGGGREGASVVYAGNQNAQLVKYVKLCLKYKQDSASKLNVYLFFFGLSM